MKTHDLSGLADIFFPPRCPFCGEVIRHGEQTCSDCTNVQPILHRKELFCADELTLPCYTIYPYKDKVRDAMLRFKFGDEPSVGVFLGNQLAILLKESCADFAFDCVTAVPMTRWHRMRRGYNQSELLAKTAAQKLEVPYGRLLRKIRRNRVQHLLSAEERYENVQGAYAALPNAAGKRILLVDDIVTTGATLSVCAEELFRVGAEQVICVAAAEAQPATDKD